MEGSQSYKLTGSGWLSFKKGAGSQVSSLIVDSFMGIPTQEVQYFPEILPSDRFANGLSEDVEIFGFVAERTKSGARCRPQTTSEKKRTKVEHKPILYISVHSRTQLNYSAAAASDVTNLEI